MAKSDLPIKYNCFFVRYITHVWTEFWNLYIIYMVYVMWNGSLNNCDGVCWFYTCVIEPSARAVTTPEWWARIPVCVNRQQLSTLFPGTIILLDIWGSRYGARAVALFPCYGPRRKNGAADGGKSLRGFPARWMESAFPAWRFSIAAELLFGMFSTERGALIV